MCRKICSEHRCRAIASGNQTVLRLRLLGGMQVITAEDRDITPSGKKLRALIACLALAPKAGWLRERLMALVWGDRDEEQARASLRQALAELRKSFGDPRAIEADRERVKLCSDLVTVDAGYAMGLYRHHCRSCAFAG